MLPFSTEQFLGVFEAYNEAVWPMQVVLGGIGLLAIILATRKPSISDFTISTVLAAFWLWMGIVYHILFFSAINIAAIGFGVLFVVQALLFLHAGPVKKQLSSHRGYPRGRWWWRRGSSEHDRRGSEKVARRNVTQRPAHGERNFRETLVTSWI